MAPAWFPVLMRYVTLAQAIYIIRPYFTIVLGLFQILICFVVELLLFSLEEIFAFCLTQVKDFLIKQNSCMFAIFSN